MESTNEIIHGKCLNAMDIENLRHFVQDYTVRALIPYVEHLVSILNDAVCLLILPSILFAFQIYIIVHK